MKTGLVLEGGAMRGMFTAGVLDVMMENGISTDGLVGVSAGAVFGCNFKSRQIGRTIRYNTRFCRDPRYCSIKSLIKTGDLYGADFCYRELPDILDPFDTKTFMENPIPFHIVCTDVDTGCPVYYVCESADAHDLTWMRASASMPLVSRIVEVDGHRLLDGGISDSIPLKYFEGCGFAKNIVVLTRPRDYRKSASSPLATLALRKYPKLCEAMKMRHMQYNDAIEYIKAREAEGAALVLAPESALPISRIEKDPKKLQETYEIGRQVATKNLDSIRSFVG